MTHIKVVLMDGDGSTLTHDGIFPENLQLLILANPQIKWIMATGRSLDLLERTPIIPFLSQDMPHVLDGGSRIMKLNGEIVQEHTITDAELGLFFAQLPLERVEFLYYFLDDNARFFYAPDLSKWADNHPLFMSAQRTDDVNKFREYTKTDPPTKVFLRTNEAIHFQGVHCNQNESNIDLTAHGVNKGSACCELLKILGVDAKSVAFVFNDRNDLPVLKHDLLKDITTIKVGEYLPEVIADYEVATPHDVADILAPLLSR
jgi:hydroxymethylpyrimidine pyrophosphatase-like HAD family hydrolase